MLTLDTVQKDLQMKFDYIKILKNKKNETALTAIQFKQRFSLSRQMGCQKENYWEAGKQK